jgi:hypothetical protein
METTGAAIGISFPVEPLESWNQVADPKGRFRHGTGMWCFPCGLPLSSPGIGQQGYDGALIERSGSQIQPRFIAHAAHLAAIQMIVSPDKELNVVNAYWTIVVRRCRANFGSAVKGKKIDFVLPTDRPAWSCLMDIALPALFALAGLGSIVVIWESIKSNLGTIVQLRRQMALPGHGSDIVVTLLEPITEFEAVAAVRRPRQVRVPAPKPVTHRLHHFGKNRSVA